MSKFFVLVEDSILKFGSGGADNRSRILAIRHEPEECVAAWNQSIDKINSKLGPGQRLSNKPLMDMDSKRIVYSVSGNGTHASYTISVKEWKDDLNEYS